MTEDALTFNPDGTCECIYTENIDLRQLGVLAGGAAWIRGSSPRKTITRAAIEM